MNKTKTQQGYILILTLLITSAAIAVVTYIFNRGSVHVPFMQTMIEREKAKMLAMSGVQIAIAQLSRTMPEEKKEKHIEKKEQKPDLGKEAKSFLMYLLPVINRWQEYELKEKIDGIDGQINICIMCEEGKININQIYDFEHLAFVGEKQKQGNWKLVMQEICKRIEKISKGKDLFQAIEKFLKTRQYKINDVTELLTIKEFAVFKNAVFYEPHVTLDDDFGSSDFVGLKKGKRPIYLTDIFTVWSQSSKIEPWFFSDSINGVFNFPRAQANEINKRKGQVEGWTKEFKQKTTWKSDWKKYMVPLYGKELRTLPKDIELMFSSTFDPIMFSVLCYATVGKVTQRVFAILERTRHSQNEQIVYDVKIKKLYWL